jgi:hypothetical protein
MAIQFRMSPLERKKKTLSPGAEKSQRQNIFLFLFFFYYFIFAFSRTKLRRGIVPRQEPVMAPIDWKRK